MMLRCLLYLKIAFNSGCDKFSFSKGVDLFILWDFKVLTTFEKKIFTFSAFLASFVNILLLFTRVIFSEDFTLSKKKALIFFQDCNPYYLSRLKLALTY